MSINKSFKAGIRKHYDAWLIEDKHALTPSGKIKMA
jgi:hypothetical protein